MENQVMAELHRLLESSSAEEQQKIFHALDYVANYFVGDRRVPTLSLQGFSKELQQLEDIDVLNSTSESWRGHLYERINIKQGIEQAITKLLQEKYLPVFTIEMINKKIQSIARDSQPSALTKMWSTVNEYKITEYSISNWSEDTREVELLAERLAAEGLCYVIGYHSSSWGAYYKEMIFRKQPNQVRDIFLNIVGDEIKKILASLSAVEKWCLYVKHLYPQADEKFLLKNTTTSRLPLQIKQALPQLPSIDLGKFGKNSDLIIAEQKEKQAKDLKSLSNRDPIIVATLGTLFTVAREEKNYRKVDSLTINKFLETLGDAEIFKNYLSFLKSGNLILESLTGDYIIPNSVWEAFAQEIKGETEIKFFESELDAQAFLEETMSKALSNIKIWDPYVKNRTLAILKKAIQPDKITIEILTSDEESKEGIKNLIDNKYRIQTKIIHDKKDKKIKPWHDRYLIIDNGIVWHLGPSIGDAGRKPHESAVHFSSSLGARIVEAFEYNLSKGTDAWQKDNFEVIEIGVHNKNGV